MADVAINDLPAATNVQAADLLVLWQQASNSAKSISGQSFTTWLTAYADGHGGIQSIAKTSSTGTNPVVDTYTITLADTTTATFTVTNGLKGDTGDQTYVWVAYSTDEPTSDADISTIPDAWMGIYAGLESTFSNLHYTDFDWYEIKGDKGDTGTPITAVTRTAGDGSPGTTDTYTVYADEDAVGTFNVYNGINGTGAVNSVNGKYPDASGNVALTPQNIGAQSALSGTNIVIFGDSWTQPTIPNSGYEYWPIRVSTALGMTRFNFAIAGAGWGRSGNLIKTQIDTAASQMTSEEKLNTTVVIALLGYNDILNDVADADILTGFSYFNTQCATLFPNAKQIAIPFNWGFGVLNETPEIKIERLIDSMFSYVTHPCTIVPDCRWWLLGSHDDYRNDGHPSDAWYDKISGKIISIILGGNIGGSSRGGTLTLDHGTTYKCYYTFENGIIHFTFYSNFSSNLSNYSSTFATLPPLLVPSHDKFFSIYTASSTVGVGRLTVSGTFAISGLTLAANTYCFADFVYRANANATW